ncbi:MAG: hypothetical protein P4L16_05445 [Chlamydiales bacterium]|nr:hypothetical protein [Chlamydiales bacterium]
MTTFSVKIPAGEIHWYEEQVPILVSKLEQISAAAERFSGLANRLWLETQDPGLLNISSEETFTILNQLKPQISSCSIEPLKGIFNKAIEAQARIAVIQAMRDESSLYTKAFTEKISSAVNPTDDEKDLAASRAVSQACLEPIEIIAGTKLAPKTFQTRLSFSQLPMLSVPLFNKIMDAFPNAVHINFAHCIHLTEDHLSYFLDKSIKVLDLTDCSNITSVFRDHLKGKGIEIYDK